MIQTRESWLFKNLANIITVSGLFLTFGLIFLAATNPYRIWEIVTLVILIGLSDFLDGKVARYFKIQSAFGEAIDRFRDKIFICTVLLLLVWYLNRTEHRFFYLTPPTIILTGFVILLECGLMGRWLYDLLTGRSVKAGQNGRIKMFIQFFLVAIWLIVLALEKCLNCDLFSSAVYLIDTLLIVVIYYAIKSLIGYYQRARTVK
ncbi:MAG: CDP-alcohol phosphatidyltransferase family protein [Candidatus Staskawiczbacteria bacterium]|jgi:phosphatidylglycerophosphate synthase